ncbi:MULTISPECIES: MerR family transcriptional regulator [Pseudolactococcus]|uniref:MerR family transcriptional regulator n=1 Tax=Pseudolactococcus carnosus TaxID=2749961 RepID=A0ABT0AVD1_9LACT|nr:MerR family transcriptional regulator [Lactococcus carnosus]MCJ1990707.1 MerR family transcriptional regulator [Lactococcus carnosus]
MDNTKIEKFNEKFLIANIEKQLSILIDLIIDKRDSKPSLGILTQKELLEQLNIAPNTLKSWELKGLKRLEPPIEGTRTVYYKVSDVIRFLEN